MATNSALITHVTGNVPQSEPIPGKTMTRNNAGGYVFEVDDWVKLSRFLILGSEGGSYYASANKMTADGASCIGRCFAADADRTLAEIQRVSDRGLGASNSQAIFALALCLNLAETDADRARVRAVIASGSVIRIGTHLFEFMEYHKSLGLGWGRGNQRAIRDLMSGMDASRLAYQSVKYRSRKVGGDSPWTWRDVARLVHPNSDSPAHNAVYGFMSANTDMDAITANADEIGIIDAYLEAQTLKKDKAGLARGCELIVAHNLPWEALPTELHNSPEIWEAMLPKMPLGALTRQLARFSRIGMLGEMSDAESAIVNRFGDTEAIRKARLHPLKVMQAHRVYGSGGRMGLSRGNPYTPNRNVMHALDGAFQASFDTVEPAGKRTLLAIDISGSMSTSISGSQLISCRDAAAAMALVTHASEPQTIVKGFSAVGTGRARWGSPASLIDYPLPKSGRFSDIQTPHWAGGGTDCSLPMKYALENKVPVDTFVVYTDSETWAGDVHASVMLKNYRDKMGIPARLAVVGMVANPFSIADPADAGMMDFVGMSPDTPAALTAFSKGDI